jgi:sugar phosphate isomerase/epimerase
LLSSRRAFLKLLPFAAGTALAQIPELHFPAQPRDRLAVTSWPFRAYIVSPTNPNRKSSVPGMDLTDFPQFVVEKFGVRNINPLAAHFRSTDPAYLDAFRSAVEKAGSHLVDLGIGAGDFYSSDPAVQQQAFAYGSKWVDIASHIGSPSVRQHLRVRPGDKPDAALLAQALGRLVEYGTKRNIVINLENDDRIAEDPFVIVAAIEKVNSPYLRALPDFGNSLAGHDAEYSANGVAAMLKHVFNMCHVKDVLETEGGQQVKVDLARMFGLAKQASYRGYYSMEFDTDAGDPVVGTKNLVETTLKYLG